MDIFLYKLFMNKKNKKNSNESVFYILQDSNLSGVKTPSHEEKKLTSFN